MNAMHQFETKIMFTGVEHSEAVADYIEKKLESAKKLLAGERDGLSGVFRVEVGQTTKHHRSGDIFRAEINFQGNGYNIRAEAERTDIYAALDAAKDELDREIRKSRKRKLTLAKHGGGIVKNILRGLRASRSKS